MDETLTSEQKFAESGRDWAFRGIIFLTFLFFGCGKFKSEDANAPWVVLYDQIGFGQGFRYLTAVIEILGAFLVIIPQTVAAGLWVLICVMTGATLIDVAVLRRSADAVLPFAILCALIALWLRRRR